MIATTGLSWPAAFLLTILSIAGMAGLLGSIFLAGDAIEHGGRRRILGIGWLVVLLLVFLTVFMHGIANGTK